MNQKKLIAFAVKQADRISLEARTPFAAYDTAKLAKAICDAIVDNYKRSGRPTAESARLERA